MTLSNTMLRPAFSFLFPLLLLLLFAPYQITALYRSQSPVLQLSAKDYPLLIGPANSTTLRAL